MDTRSYILQTLYKLFPFKLTGDTELSQTQASVAVSCIINFYGRAGLLRNILTCLSEQEFAKDSFEVILAEDRGGTEEGKEITRGFGNKLNIRYFTLEENFGIMGYARNFALSKSRGEYILFLDDDTVILDSSFLEVLTAEFEETGADAVMPYGSASFSVIRDRYNYHDPYFPTNRCMAYRREALRELCGFVSEIIGQEDVELTVRLIASRKKIHRSNMLSYMHPPLIYKNTDKAAAVGYSFAKLRHRYPLIIWLTLLLNGVRYLPLYLIPFNTKFRMQAKFSLGFAKGIWYSVTGRKIEYN
jgi:glycosyltransferase involved in cell wall biosynthesis